MTGKSNWLGDAEALREQFDRGFTFPAQAPQADAESFIGIRDGEQCLALPIRDVARLERRRTLVELPTASGQLLGLIGIQGRLLPTFRLSSCLGFESGGDDWHWIILARADVPLAFAFESLVSYFTAGPADRLALGEDHVQGHTRGALRCAGEIWNIVDLPSIQAAVCSAVRAVNGADKEPSLCKKD